MTCSQNGNVIQMPLFQSIPSRPRAQEERVGYIFINILDPNYVFPPPETPAKCPQQQVSAPSMLSGDCLHMFTYPALPGIPPAQPALSSGTLSMYTTAYEEGMKDEREREKKERRMRVEPSKRVRFSKMNA